MYSDGYEYAQAISWNLVPLENAITLIDWYKFRALVQSSPFDAGVAQGAWDALMESGVVV